MTEPRPPASASSHAHSPPQVTPAESSSRRQIITNTYDPALSRWGLGDALASITVYFAASVGLVFFILVVIGADDFLAGPWLPVGLVGPHVAMFVHLTWVARVKGTGLANDFRMQFAAPDISLGFGLFVAGLITASTAAVVIEKMLGEPPTAAAVELARESSGDGITVWLYLFAFLGATFVPVVEELAYRGLLWSALEKRNVHPWIILLGTSTLFAVVHLEPARTPVLFIVGVALGLGRLRTGRIGASIFTHMLINILAMLATLIDLA